MKNWQHGFELDYLISIQDRYKEHNTYALGPFLEVKKNSIASALHEKKLLLTENGAISVAESKVKSPITMHGDTIIGHKQPGDITFSKITNFDQEIKDTVYANLGNNCWLFTWAEWQEANDFALENGFDYIGCKVCSFSEIQSVYYRDAINVLEPREHPKLLGAETINIKNQSDSFEQNTYEKNIKRQNERATASHNTVKINESEQSEGWAGFRVARRAKITSLIEKEFYISAKQKQVYKFYSRG